MKNILKIIGLIIFIIFAALIFFSKTIYNYNVPLVTISIPKSGDIIKTEKTSGIAAWQNIDNQYSDTKGKITDILIKKGDLITIGQPLIKLTFDKKANDTKIQDNNKKIQDINLNIKQIQLEIEGIYNKIASLEAKILEQNTKKYESSKISESDIEKSKNIIKQIEQNIEITKNLYNSGAVPKSDLDKLEEDLKNAQLDLKNALDRQKDELDKQTKLEKDFYENIANTIKNHEDEIESQNFLLKTKQLSIDNYNVQILQIQQDSTELDTNSTIYATKEGTVTELAVNVGQAIEGNTLILKMAQKESLIITAEVSKDNKFINLGDTVKLSSGDDKYEGIIDDIKTEEGKRNAKIKVQSEKIKDGQVFDVTFEKKYKDQKMILPNGAINKDNDGNYIYEIRKREGILGEEYYATVLRVIVGESDDTNTSITKGITFIEPIVIGSNKVFSNGETVQIKNEADIIAK